MMKNEINLQDGFLNVVRQQSHKHAISTIIPQNRVELYQKREGRSGETS